MTRWHKSSCKAPHIVVDEMIPRCMACNSSPPLRELISKSSSINPFPPIPPDEPPEQLNLWWPPCVPYSKSGPGQSAHSGRQAESPGVCGQSTKASSHHRERDSKERAPEGIDSSVLEATTLGLHNSEIYGNTLGVDEFRLLCLSPAVIAVIPFMRLSRPIDTIALPIMKLSLTPGVEKKGTALYAAPLISGHTGTYYYRQGIAGQCFVICGHGEGFE